MDNSGAFGTLAKVNLADISLSLNDLVGLIVTWVLCLVIVLGVWWLSPKLLRRLSRWVDGKIPMALSEYVRPVLLVLAGTLSAIVLTGGGIATADILGVDIDWAKDAAQDGGAAAGTWLGPRVARIAVILALGVLVMRASSRLIPPLLKQFLSRRAGGPESPGETAKRERTLAGVASNAVKILVITLVGFIFLSEMDVDLAPLLAAAGVIGIAIGFGAQSLVRDIFGGIFIILEDQYRVNDVVRIGGVAGLVEDINLRRTLLRDLDYIQHVIPNGEVRVASNFTKEKSRVNLNISVAYKEDLDRVIAVIDRVGAEMSQDPYFGPLITDPLKTLRVDAFEESGIAIKVLGETLPIRQWDVAGEFRRRIKRAFDEEGIEIPFPHRTVYWGAGVETQVRQLVEDSKMEDKPESPVKDAPKDQL